MPNEFAQRCVMLLSNLGLAQPEDIVEILPLTGGVASDIGVIGLKDRQICVKFALAKLKVSEDWRAPVHRNKAEYAWLEAAARVVPDNVPKLFGWSVADNGFAMEFLTGDKVYLWKTALLKEAPDRGEARKMGAVLGAIHAASSAPGFDRTAFQNRDDFEALRLEPYLKFTATRHPELATRLGALADRLYEAEIALVHGDVSPKNILFRDGVPIILDAECATMGDPAFDVAFCLNHLILKAVHLSGSRVRLLSAVGMFWSAYADKVTWEATRALEARVAALLPALMLARVDGKSPVEYLDEAERAGVRALAKPLIANSPTSLAEIVKAINTGSTMK